MARSYLDPVSIFQIEVNSKLSLEKQFGKYGTIQVEEALEKVKVSIRNLKEFKTCFQEYKSRLPSYFTGDKTPKTWEFQVGTLIYTGFLGDILYLD